MDDQKRGWGHKEKAFRERTLAEGANLLLTNEGRSPQSRREAHEKSDALFAHFLVLEELICNVLVFKHDKFMQLPVIRSVCHCIHLLQAPAIFLSQAGYPQD